MSDESADRWESVGRDLLAEQLEIMGRDTLQHAFVNAMRRIQAGEELTKRDIDEMRQALEEAKQLVNIAADASPEDTALPDPHRFLTEEGQREYQEEVEARRRNIDETSNR